MLRGLDNLRFHLSLLASLLLLTPVAAFCSVTLITGTPGNALLSTPTSFSPNLGGILINFSTLTPFESFSPSSPYTVDGVSFSSPDGLTVLPFSTQTANPNELYDNGPNGVADLTISTSFAASAIGVGIADSDTDPPLTSVPPAVPIEIELQPLGAGGVDLGSPFLVTIPENTANPGNAYFVVEDSTPGLYGLEIIQPLSNPDFSGLAISDVQITPEPASFPLMAGGIAAILFFARRRKKA